MKEAFITLAEPAGFEEEIKKSRFVCYAARVDSVEEAQVFLESVRDPQATHNCWAYKIGQQYRFSDDGEPGGTAGQPILRAIEGHGLDHVMAVVIRYFGGVKLGAGGLVRAYGGVTAECLRRARKMEIVPRTRLLVEIPYALSSKLYPLLVAAEARVLGELGRTQTLKGMSSEEIMAMNDPAALGRALEERARGVAKDELKDLYERMLTQTEIASEKVNDAYRDSAGRAERMAERAEEMFKFDRGVDVRQREQENILAAERRAAKELLASERRAAESIERMANRGMDQMGNVASTRARPASDGPGGDGAVPKVRICTKCKHEVADTENFCPYCGTEYGTKKPE